MRFVPLLQHVALVVWSLSVVIVAVASYWLLRAGPRMASKVPGVLRTFALWLAGIAAVFGIGAAAISLILVHRGSSRGTVTAVTWLVAATLAPGAFVTATVSLLLRNAESIVHPRDTRVPASRTIVPKITALLRRRSGNVRAG